MISMLISLLIWLVIAGIVFLIVKYILDMVPMDARFKQIAYLILALIIVLVLIQKLLPLLRGVGGF